MLTKRRNGQAGHSRLQALMGAAATAPIDRRTFLRRSGLAVGGMAAIGSLQLGTVRKAAASVLADLHAAGYPQTPDVIVDRLGEGRYPHPSTPNTWRVSLTRGLQQGELRYQITRAAVQFPCHRVDPVHGNAVVLWAATVTGEQATYDAHMKGRAFPKEKEVRRTVRNVLASDPREQAEWYRQSLANGCRQQPCCGGSRRAAPTPSCRPLWVSSRCSSSSFRAIRWRFPL